MSKVGRPAVAQAAGQQGSLPQGDLPGKSKEGHSGCAARKEEVTQRAQRACGHWARLKRRLFQQQLLHHHCGKPHAQAVGAEERRRDRPPAAVGGRPTQAPGAVGCKGGAVGEEPGASRTGHQVPRAGGADGKPDLRWQAEGKIESYDPVSLRFNEATAIRQVC